MLNEHARHTESELTCALGSQLPLTGVPAARRPGEWPLTGAGAAHCSLQHAQAVRALRTPPKQLQVWISWAVSLRVPYQWTGPHQCSSKQDAGLVLSMTLLAE